MSESSKILKEAKRYNNHLFQTEQWQAHEVVGRLLDYALDLEVRNKELEGQLEKAIATIRRCFGYE